MSENQNSTNTENTSSTTTTSNDINITKSTSKYKVAIVFGYVGYGYFGLNHNFDPAHPTIEAALIDALHDVGYISDENMMGTFLKKINFERASRTDKGVSALRNVVSCKLTLPNNVTETEWIRPLNEKLASKRIRVVRIISTTSSFDCYINCTGRLYEYMLPTYCLLSPNDENARELRAMLTMNHVNNKNNSNNKDDDEKQEEENISISAAAASSGASNQNNNVNNNAKEEEEEIITESTLNRRRKTQEENIDSLCSSSAGENVSSNSSEGAKQQQQQQQRRVRDDPSIDPLQLSSDVYEQMKKFRVSDDVVQKLRGYLSSMEGTNSFHNFTPSISSDDPSATRFIRFISVTDPFLIPISTSQKNKKKMQEEEQEQEQEEEKMPDFTQLQIDGSATWAKPVRIFKNNNNSNQQQQNENNNISDDDKIPSSSSSNNVTQEKETVTETKEQQDEEYIEWVSIQLDGQSFILNQIRKMVGCAVEAVIRGANTEFVRSMFQPSFKRLMPMAPANGLFLSTLRMDKYNHKLERIQEEGKNAVGKEMIKIETPAETDPIRILVESSLALHEAEETITARWIVGLLKTEPEDFVPKN